MKGYYVVIDIQNQQWGERVYQWRDVMTLGMEYARLKRRDCFEVRHCYIKKTKGAKGLKTDKFLVKVYMPMKSDIYWTPDLKWYIKSTHLL